MIKHSNTTFIKDYDFYVSGSIQQGIVPLDKIYTDLFFKDNIADSLPMARYLAPQIVKELECKSVLDIGCATGHWLSCFADLNVKISGLEGSLAAFEYMLINKDFKFPKSVNRKYLFLISAK